MFKVYFAQRTDAAGDDRTEHGNAGAAENGIGIQATTAAILGSRPKQMRMMPDAATTKRLLTRVNAMRPTFWANAV